METKKTEPARILVVDDIQMNVDLMAMILEGQGHVPMCATSVNEAIDLMREQGLPSLILSDLSMPEIDGLKFCRMMKESPKTRDIPFVFISVMDTDAEKEAAFQAGAVDYIAKPFNRIEVEMRVSNHLATYKLRRDMVEYNRMMHQTLDAEQRRMERERENVLSALAKVVEKRDINTGNHVDNVGYNSRLIAQALQLSSAYERDITDSFVETIEQAAKLHDIGNIVMPDIILLKEGRLSESEMEIIRTHPEEGAKILEEIQRSQESSVYLHMASNIARFHHANWDGTGYPEVAGTAIPLEARITAVANNFDVIVGKRVYKEAVPVQTAVEQICADSGRVYDPEIVQVFGKIYKQMRL